jgi:hypothetical protein
LFADNKRSPFQLPYELILSATMSFASSERIGGGASCSVFRANIFGVSVAVKALTTMEGETEKKRKAEEKQFVAEMNLLMGVTHPNICRCVLL